MELATRQAGRRKGQGQHTMLLAAAGASGWLLTCHRRPRVCQRQRPAGEHHQGQLHLQQGWSRAGAPRV